MIYTVQYRVNDLFSDVFKPYLNDIGTSLMHNLKTHKKFVLTDLGSLSYDIKCLFQRIKNR